MTYNEIHYWTNPKVYSGDRMWAFCGSHVKTENTTLRRKSITCKRCLELMKNTTSRAETKRIRKKLYKITDDDRNWTMNGKVTGENLFA